MKFSIKDFFSKYDQIRLVTFTEEILYGKLDFLCSERNTEPFHVHVQYGNSLDEIYVEYANSARQSIHSTTSSYLQIVAF